jgi:hypothetical protein
MATANHFSFQSARETFNTKRDVDRIPEHGVVTTITRSYGAK